MLSLMWHCSYRNWAYYTWTTMAIW